MAKSPSPDNPYSAGSVAEAGWRLATFRDQRRSTARDQEPPLCAAPVRSHSVGAAAHNRAFCVGLAAGNQGRPKARVKVAVTMAGRIDLVHEKGGNEQSREAATKSGGCAAWAKEAP